MSKLKLTKKPVRVVEIELPDGSEITFTLSTTKVKDLPGHEENMAVGRRVHLVPDPFLHAGGSRRPGSESGKRTP